MNEKNGVSGQILFCAVLAALDKLLDLRATLVLIEILSGPLHSCASSNVPVNQKIGTLLPGDRRARLLVALAPGAVVECRIVPFRKNLRFDDSVRTPERPEKLRSI